MSGVDIGIEGLSDAKEIGAGGFARVYSATETRFGRTVAVKVLFQVDAGGRRRFDREQLTMGRMTGHPNVVVPHSAGYNNDGYPYLIMEYLEGGSLQDLIEVSGPVQWEQAIEMILPIAEALGHGHSQGILHRDVKPANILLGIGDHPKLADFGIAAIREATASTQGIGFSLAHTPPETFAGGSDQRDERADLYSLASTLYTVITGRPPYHSNESNDSQLAYIVRIADHPIPDLVTGPPALNRFLQQALAKSADDRPQTAHHFNTELQAARRAPSQTITARPAPQPSQIATIKAPQPSADEHLSVGDQHLDAARYDEAITAYDRVIELDPDNTLAHNNRGDTLRNLGRYDEAITALDRAIELDPDNTLAHYNRGVALRNLGRYDEAITALDRAIELDPDNTLAHYNRGVA
ncbi:MAG: tetratricopeptide repeat protein, partial [Actinomycetia bacterium]|nr:tetratricopeptide repeat protein [Actinomycetes bacterium]